MVRLSAALVSMATALLVVGLLTDGGFAPIAFSILGSGAAGAMLLLASARNRRNAMSRVVSD